MKKVKILKDCQAYIENGILKDFKKGEICEVNEFIYNSFVKSSRAEPCKENVVNNSQDVKNKNEEKKIEEVKEENKEENIERDLKKELKKMNKEELIKYAQDNYNISFSEELTVKKMIKKIMEVDNG